MTICFVYWLSMTVLECMGNKVTNALMNNRRILFVIDVF
jgi:hypothetical protein